MASAGTYHEREILKMFSQGIKISEGLDQNKTYESTLNDPNNIDIGVEFTFSDAYSPCDLAVIFGSWKPRDKGHHLIRNSVAANAEHFICIETPLLNRKTKINNNEWRVGLNGFLNGEGIWPQLADTEANERLKEKEIVFPGWQKNENGHIVLALQLPGDASLRGTDIGEWAWYTVQELRKHTDRKIIIRTHPLSSDRAYSDHLYNLIGRITYHKIKNISYSDGATTDWEKDLKDCYCTVTYSSGFAIDSVMRGIPTIATDSANFAYKVSTNLIAEVENLKRPDLKSMQKWLGNLLACQYSEEEMSNGIAWLFIKDMLTQRGVL